MLNILGKAKNSDAYMRKFVFLAIALAGCNSSGNESERFVPARPVTNIISDTVVGTFEGAWAAVQTPFEDLNLKQKLIPDKLRQIADNPYGVPPIMLCENISAEVAELDLLLGPDICTEQNPSGTVSKKGEYIEKGANAARDRAVGMVGDKVNIIPFRGAVRYVSGAERHSKAVTQAYEAGKLRRAFLKGLAASLGSNCLTQQNPPQQ